MNGSFEIKYQKDKNFWGSEPSSVVKAQLPHFVKGTVLDVGAGDGRNALFLASQGFDVLALDIAPAGLQNIVDKAANRGLTNRIKTVAANIVNYEPEDSYENVITNFTLHFVGSENIIPVLEKLVRITKPRGINLIDDFTQNGPLAINSPENFITLSLLKDFYAKKGWEIIYSDTRPAKTKTFESPGKPYIHEAVAFIARNT